MADPRIVEHAAGLTWVHDDPLQRAAHAIGDGEGVWLVDPVDDAAPLAAAEALGPIRAVVQLLDRHERDGGAVAARLGVPLLRMPEALPGSPLQVLQVLDVPGWHERALWWPARRTLVVAEVVGTAPHYRFGPGEVGVHPFLRALTPSGARGFTPQVLLVGHGDPVEGPFVAASVERAHARARVDLLRAPLKLPALVRTGRQAGGL